MDRMSQLSQQELQAHMMLRDPNNQFMRKLTVEGAEGLRELQRAELWASIMAKKHMHSSDTNAFLNSLTEDEFTEFIQQREISVEKLEETGKVSELVNLNDKREQLIELREELLKERLQKQQVETEQGTPFAEDDMSKEFKVFRDPTFKEFI